MDTQRRNLLQALPLLAGLTLTQPLMADAATGGKPLTTASLAKSLLTLADKAELQGMKREAQAIYAAVKVVMDGTPASGKHAVVACDTDSDCERKNPKLAAHGEKQ